MIDIHAEHIFPLAKMRDHIPSRPSPATAHRWVFVGIRGVKLEDIMIGGRRYTSREAVDRFLARRNAPCTPEPAVATQASVEGIKASARASSIFGTV